ncbi:NAF1-domain-containing protein [Dentipellis sp. KUC8613]|nr:NAF1-domain-containing protein [Dentipellis sp. KUC8613]
MQAPFFKVPEIVPQDLLLIQDLVGQIQKAPEVPHTVAVAIKQEEDDIASSDDGANSEDEVEAEVLAGGEEDGSGSSKSTGLSDSSSDSSSDSDTDVEEDIKPTNKRKQVEDEDDEDGEPSSTAILRTKNELLEGDIIVPQISEVGPDEQLEKVGEIMSIIDKVAIVKGHASQAQNRASEKALDSETLLVFEDRKVLGHVFETFGPTYQPLYQIKFTNDFPLNPDQVIIGREVFHVPQRSNFVFLSELKRIKGSDASNVHDEEPAEYELEFSDDEEEAAYKARMKQRRQASREPSIVGSSRHSTPVPSRYTTPSRDQNIAADSFYGSNPFDAHGPYDMDYGVAAGPSRPAPKPYDDPYSDEYNTAAAAAVLYGTSPSETLAGTSVSSDASDHGEYGRNRGRGRGRRPDRGGRAIRDHEPRGRPYDRGGRGRGRGRGSGDAYSGGRGGHQSIPPTHPPRSLSPTSLAIATATGQFPTDSGYAAASPLQAAAAPQAAWSYDPYQPQQSQQQMFAFGGHAQPYVQPHINPRFASQLGFNMGFMGQGQQSQQQQQQQQQYSQYSQYGAGMGSYGAAGQTGQGWSGQWDYSNGPLPHGQGPSGGQT